MFPVKLGIFMIEDDINNVSHYKERVSAANEQNEADDWN